MTKLTEVIKDVMQSYGLFTPSGKLESSKFYPVDKGLYECILLNDNNYLFCIVLNLPNNELTITIMETLPQGRIKAQVSLSLWDIERVDGYSQRDVIEGNVRKLCDAISEKY